MGRYSKPVSTATKPPIKEILEHYGAPRVPDAGRGWAAMRCPFHGDTSASASVSVALNCFKCHSCNFGGDSYAVVEWREDTRAFPDTIRAAERILGYSLNGVSKSTRGRRRRATLFDGGAQPVKGQTSIFQTRVR